MNNKIILSLIGIIAFCISPVFAISVTELTMNPSGDVMELKPISSEFTLVLSPSGEYTTDPWKKILITSDLQNVKWVTRLTLEDFQGPEIKSEGNSLVLPGWQLAYPIGTKEKVRISVSGSSPLVQQSKTIPIFTILEFNSDNGETIPGSEQAFGKLVINTSDISFLASDLEKELYSLKLEIARREVSKNYRGQSAADTLYTQAETGIAHLKTLKPEEYSTAANRAMEIRDAIEQAREDLRRQEAQQHINVAMADIRNVTQITTWFQNSNSTRDYPGLAAILNRTADAEHSLSLSSSAMGLKQWDESIANADIAKKIAEDTLPEAQRLQKRAMDPLTPLWDNLWIVGVCIIAGIIYILFKPRKKKQKKRKKNGDGKIVQ